MLKLSLVVLGLTSVAMLAVPLALSSHAAPRPEVLVAPAYPEAHLSIPTEATIPPLEQEDPWFSTLRARVEMLSDAYVDKPHTHHGLPAGEPLAGRLTRLDQFTHGVLDAVRARAGELAQFGPDAAWKYAVTLACIAHRETRIARDPSKLGDQDQGRARGYWQIWERADHADRFSAATALDMLLKEPKSAWSLPSIHPWTGYPECAAWLAAHPAPSP